MFSSRFIENIEDGETYRAMVRAYDDFSAEDYCSVAPDRLFGNAAMPATGVEYAIAEMKRAASIGLRSVCLGSFPNGSGEPRPEDDAFWLAATEDRMAVTAHSAMGVRSNPFLVLQSARGIFDLQTALLSRTMPPPAFGIVRDPLVMRMCDLLGTDHVMWGSDFPHSVSSYPESRRWLEEIISAAPGSPPQAPTRPTLWRPGRAAGPWRWCGR